MTVAFFPERRLGRPGLVLFLNAGDPPFGELRRLVLLLDEGGVDCLELAVPFLNKVTDGPAIQRSARRALDNGADLSSVLSFVAAIRPQLQHLKIVLMVDWCHTARALPISEFLSRVRHAECDGLLLHGVPPTARRRYYESAHGIGQPIVTTCYISSSARIVEEAAVNATAYVYLVSHYGRGESADRPCASHLAPAIRTLREITPTQIAAGFGIRSREDVRTVWEAGADAAIVGSACVTRLEQAIAAGRDPIASVGRFLQQLREPPGASSLRRAGVAGRGVHQGSGSAQGLRRGWSQTDSS